MGRDKETERVKKKHTPDFHSFRDGTRSHFLSAFFLFSLVDESLIERDCKILRMIINNKIVLIEIHTVIENQRDENKINGHIGT